MSPSGVSRAFPFPRRLKNFAPEDLIGRRPEARRRALGSASENLAGHAPPPTIQKRDPPLELTAKSDFSLSAGEARALEGALAEPLWDVTLSPPQARPFPNPLANSPFHPTSARPAGANPSGASAARAPFHAGRAAPGK
jgi:hypothetical protein